MTENQKALIIFICFMAAFGWAGTDDYNYRCDQAKKMNKNETCKMVASKP